MSSSIMMMGTPVSVARTTWQAAVLAPLPVLLVVMAPAVSAAPIPCMLVEASADSARLQALVPPGTVFPLETELQLLNTSLEVVGAGIVE